MSYFERTTLKDEFGANIGSSNPLPIDVFGGVTITNTRFGVSVANFPATYPITSGGSVNVGLLGGISITNSSFGSSVTNFPANYPITAGGSINVGLLGGSIANKGFGATVTNWPTDFGASITNWAGMSGQYVNANIIGGSINIEMTAEITGASLNATITNWSGILGNTILVGNLARTVTPGSSWTIDINETGFGSSVSNFPTSYPITTGGSINVGLLGGSIANSAFGATISNWSGISGQYLNATIVGGSISVEMTAEIVGASVNATVTNFPAGFTSIPGSSWSVNINETGFGASVSNFPSGFTSTPGSSWSVDVNETGFGASITNWSGMSGMPVSVTIGGNSIYNSGFGATVTNWPIVQIVGVTNTINVNSHAVTAGSSWSVDINETGFGASVSNFPTSFGASVSNFPTVFDIHAGESLNFGILGGSIANKGFGASVTNFPAGFTSTPGSSWTVDINETGFGASVTNWPTVQIVGITNNINVRTSTDHIMNGSVELTPNFHYFDVGLSAGNEVISGLSGYRIRVLQYALTVGISCQIQWEDGVTNLTGLMPFGAPGGIASPYSPVGLFQTGVSYPLILGTNVGSSVAGHLVYVNI